MSLEWVPLDRYEPASLPASDPATPPATVPAPGAITVPIAPPTKPPTPWATGAIQESPFAGCMGGAPESGAATGAPAGAIDCAGVPMPTNGLSSGWMACFALASDAAVIAVPPIAAAVLSAVPQPELTAA